MRKVTLRGEYEEIRLNRYKAHPINVKYTEEEFQMYYDIWAKATGKRDGEWQTYCDVRDGKPFGTNAEISGMMRLN